MSASYLVRYGTMSEVGRFDGLTVPLAPGANVVVRTRRGEEIGCVVGLPGPEREGRKGDSAILRVATESDLVAASSLQARCEADFPLWRDRIRDWAVEVELVDAERTLDGGKLILYVLNGRGAETTKLALKAAASGFGVIEVQPVVSEGLVDSNGTGGCGSGGCGRKNPDRA